MKHLKKLFRSMFFVIVVVIAFECSSIECFAFDNIEKGDTGDAVKEIQEQLINRGYFDGEADGSFGEKTEEAIIAFQEENRLDATGIVGEATWNALHDNATTAKTEDSIIDSDEIESEPTGEAEVDVEEPEDVFIKHDFLYDSYGDTLYFAIVKNNIDKDVSVQINTIARNADSSMIGAGSADIEVLSPGAESLCVVYFDSITKEEIDSCETTLNYSEESYYFGINNNLETEISDTGNKIVVAVTNKGDVPAMFVEGYAFFFDGDDCIGYDSRYFTDDDSEIKPGATIVEELSFYNSDGRSYDHFELAFDGRAD